VLKLLKSLLLDSSFSLPEDALDTGLISSVTGEILEDEELYSNSDKSMATLLDENGRASPLAALTHVEDGLVCSSLSISEAWDCFLDLLLFLLFLLFFLFLVAFCLSELILREVPSKKSSESDFCFW
jgi:hypothetical protein